MVAFAFDASDGHGEYNTFSDIAFTVQTTIFVADSVNLLPCRLVQFNK